MYTVECVISDKVLQSIVKRAPLRYLQLDLEQQSGKTLMRENEELEAFIRFLYAHFNTVM